MYSKQICVKHNNTIHSQGRTFSKDPDDVEEGLAKCPAHRATFAKDEEETMFGGQNGEAHATLYGLDT